MLHVMQILLRLEGQGSAFWTSLHICRKYELGLKVKKKQDFYFGLEEIFSSAEDRHAFGQMQVWHPSNSSVYFDQI